MQLVHMGTGDFKLQKGCKGKNLMKVVYMTYISYDKICVNNRIMIFLSSELLTSANEQMLKN